VSSPERRYAGGTTLGDADSRRLREWWKEEIDRSLFDDLILRKIPGARTTPHMMTRTMMMTICMIPAFLPRLGVHGI
jgi:hypothetical protein